MKKIAVIETSNILRLRIEKLLHQYDLNPDYLTPNKNTYDNIKFFIKNYDMMILDLDAVHNYDHNIIEEIVANKPHNNFQIVVMSSQVTKHQLIEFAKLGVMDIITKPFNNYDLMAKILKYTSAPTYDSVQLKEEKHLTSQNILIWSNNLSVNDETIDNEHKMIIEKFAHLYELMKKGKGHEYYQELIDFLQFYIETHFAHEEALQEKIDYPGMIQHRALHQDFINQIKTIINSDSIDKVSNKTLITISLFLKNWLLHHILVEDTKISNYTQKNQL